MQNCEDNMMGIIVPTIIINFVGTAFLMGLFRVWDRANAITFLQEARASLKQVSYVDNNVDTSAKPVDTAEITVEVELPKNLQGFLSMVDSDGNVKVKGISMGKITAAFNELLNAPDSEAEYLVKTVDRLRR